MPSLPEPRHGPMTSSDGGVRTTRIAGRARLDRGPRSPTAEAGGLNPLQHGFESHRGHTAVARLLNRFQAG